MSPADNIKIKLASFSHGGGCGWKIAPGVLSEILKSTRGSPSHRLVWVVRDTAPYN